MREVREHRTFEFEDFRLDSGNLLLFRSGEQLNLTPKVIETLLALVEGQGEVLSKDQLMRTLWPDTVVEESNLSQNLYVLRKALGKNAAGKPFIETLRRRGYRFCGTVSFSQPQFKPVEQPRPLRIERSDNIYSVVDWRRGDDSAPQVKATPKRSLWLVPVIVLFFAAGIGGALFGLYRTSATGRNSGNEQLVPFDGSSVERLTTSGRTKRAAVSPDGRYITHVTHEAEGDSLWVRQISSPADIRIAGPSASEFAWVAFARDGNSVLLLTLDRGKGDTELLRVPTLGGPAEKAAHDTGPVGFSPDGVSMAFIRNYHEESRLMVADIDGSNERSLASHRQPEYFNITWNAPAWSPDGKTIACPVGLSSELGQYETITGIDLASGAEHRLTESRWQQVGQPQWSKNGLLITAAERSTDPQQVWHVSLSGGTTKRITHDLNDYYDVSLSADGSIMTAVQDHVVSSFWVSDGKNFSDAKQISSEIGSLEDLAWTHDGRIVYRSNAGSSSEIWMMDADGSDPRQVTAGSQAGYGLTVSPDDRRIVFSSDRSGHANLWSVEIDGSDLKQLTGGSGEFYPQFTPDNRWIVYQQGGIEPVLWKMPASGGESVELTTTRASQPAISPDGKLIAYHYLDPEIEGSRRSIGIGSVESGDRLKRFDFPSTVIWRLVRWTPDGRSVAFANTLDGVTDIWLQPIDGRPAKQYSSLRAENVFAFEWSPDGRNIALIRGAETSDVVLFHSTGP